MRREGQSYQNIREYLDTVPVIDTHEHYAGISEPIDNVFELFASYSMADFSSAAFGADEQPRRLLRDPELTFEQGVALFEPYYQCTRHTAYLQGALRGVRACYGTRISRKIHYGSWRSSSRSGAPTSTRRCSTGTASRRRSST